MFKTNNKSLKITTKEKLNFLESFSSLLNSGIPISNALKIIEYQTKSKKTKILISQISKNINSGISLEESFIQFPKIFNNFDISLIKYDINFYGFCNSKNYRYVQRCKS